MLNIIIDHLNAVLWDEKFVYNNKSYVWHFKLWEFYALGLIASAVLYALMIAVTACATY